MADKLVRMKLAKLFKTLPQYNSDQFAKVAFIGSDLDTMVFNDSDLSDAYNALTTPSVNGLPVPPGINKKSTMQTFLASLKANRTSDNPKKSDEYTELIKNLTETVNPDIDWEKYIEDDLEVINEINAAIDGLDLDEMEDALREYLSIPDDPEPQESEKQAALLNPPVQPQESEKLTALPPQAAAPPKPSVPPQAAAPPKPHVPPPKVTLPVVKKNALPVLPTLSKVPLVPATSDKCSISNITFHVLNGALETIRLRSGGPCATTDLEAYVLNKAFVLVIDIKMCSDMIFPVTLRFNGGRTIQEVVSEIVKVIVAINNDNYCGDKLAQGNAVYIADDFYMNPGKNIVCVTIKHWGR